MLKRTMIFISILIITGILTGCSFPDGLQSISDSFFPDQGNTLPTSTVATDTPIILTSEIVTITSGPSATMGPTHTPEPTQTVGLTATPSDLDVYLDSKPDTEENQEDEDTNIYEVQPGSPVALPNFAYPEVSCSWLGIGGQVFNFLDQPELNVVVEAGGTLNGNDVFALSLTGLADQFGEGGYELYLSDQPVDSTGTVWVELYNLTGEQLSERVYVDTYSSCGQNLILLNFVKTNRLGDFNIFFPLIYNQ